MFSLILLSTICWLAIFILDTGSGVRYGVRGGSKTTIQQAPTTPAPNPQETAYDVLQAQLKTNPQAAQQAFDIATNPEYGLQPFTQAIENARQNVFGQESAVRDQLLSNILGNLISPTGVNPEQQQAIDLRRSQSQDELVKALRERANLGGGLYGGRAANTEENAVRDLQAAFSEEDVTREERARLNAIQAAIPALQVLFPEIGITAPQFTSPAASGDTALQGAYGYTNNVNSNAAQQAMQQNQLRSSLYGSLFGGLGQAAGGFLGNTSLFK